MTHTGQTTRQLPSLPQVLLHILDVMQGDDMSFSQLAEHIRQDSAISARLLAIANSTSNATGARPLTIERALLVLGIDTIKTVVITTAIRQYFSGFAHYQQNFLKSFWRRSLMIAHAAQKLAQLTGYHSPDQAYLTGLLTDVGQLLLLQQYDQAYLDQWDTAADDEQLLQAEHRHFSRSHPEVGAALIAGWRIDPVMIDAIYRHHDRDRSLANSHQLVQIINLASRLSVSDNLDANIDSLFGFCHEFLTNLQKQISGDAKQLAQDLDIDAEDNQHADSEHAHELLGQQVAHISQQAQVRSALSQAADDLTIDATIQRVVHIILDIKHSLLFMGAPDQSTLKARPSNSSLPANGLNLPLTPGHCIVGDAFLKNQMLDSQKRAALTAFDRSLLRICQSERFICLPLIHADKPLGVLVLGVDESWSLPIPAATMLSQEIAAVLEKQSAAGLVSKAELQDRIEEAIHEAGNPISIIGNYLEMLRMKLGHEHQAARDIEMIRQEIERVGSILLQLKETTPAQRANEALDVNTLIEQLSHIFRNSIFAANKLTLNLRLDPDLQPITSDAASIKQIIINLVKNAAEALEENGIVTIATATTAAQAGEQLTVTIEDNGPGIPDKLRETLFLPNISGKGGGHTGLGLSITKRLVEELGGTIDWASGEWGSRFVIRIPT